MSNVPMHECCKGKGKGQIFLQRYLQRQCNDQLRRTAYYSVYRPRKDERLSRPGWLVTYGNKVPPPGVEPGHVTHPSTNRARRRVTSLIRPTPLPLRQADNQRAHCTPAASCIRRREGQHSADGAAAPCQINLNTCYSMCHTFAGISPNKKVKFYNSSFA